MSRLDPLGALEPLDELLARYAEARLSPPEGWVTRLRAWLVGTYVESFEGLAPVAARRRRVPRRAPRRGPRLRWAFLFATMLALTLGTSLAAAESGPGQPFYHLRLSLEALSIPAQGEARLQALLTRLDARLAEARQASQHGDHSAVADAMSAYEETLAALSASVDAAGSQQWVLDRLAGHEDVLTELLGRTPPQAQQGLQKALEQTQHARDAIGHRPTTPGHGPPTSAPGATQPTGSP